MMSKSKCEWRTSTNEEQQQNEDQKTNEDTTKTFSEVLPSKVPSLRVFDFRFYRPGSSYIAFPILWDKGVAGAVPAIAKDYQICFVHQFGLPL